MKKLVLLLIVSCAAVVTVSAQVKKVLADGIVGQVGDKIILRSDVRNAIEDMKRRAAQSGQENAVLPTECQVMEGQLIRKALVLQAQKDSLHVNEDELDGELDNRIRYYIQAYGGKEVLEEIEGKTVYQIKEDFRESLREQKLADQMQQKIVELVKITPTEVKAFYARTPKDSLPFYESEVEVSEIVVHPKANKDVEEYVAKQMSDYKKQAEAQGPKKFDQLAKTYSEDPAVKENGGQYTLNRNDKNTWDPTFLKTAFSLKEGQISAPVKSKFGLHIIMMVSRAGDEAVVKHILRIPPIADIEINETKKMLDSVRKNLIDGTISFGAAVSKYSDDEQSKFTAGSKTGRDANGQATTFLTIDQLDKDMVVLLKDLKPGSYSAPQVTKDERGSTVVRLVYLRNRTEPHRENLKEDYDRVAKRALEEKKTGALEKWFKEHIPTYFVSIDKDFASCSSLNEWSKAAANAAQARN
ncbi:peptidylprolyl isomerase [Sediminibacterium roseum]|uniref:Peptidylprolyl isomerase n=1 Tax=Sediminibacterium roseum TaxID=1978412 RepID=A0ABW9ZZL5_9BACT|nr:peptidylprolyl isomerase [Sediminibacterium roseum]NCI51990.1 peptidylprolyl isomerase [Sediminibacterium roseum]